MSSRPRSRHLFSLSALAFLYPGSKGFESEFPDLLPKIGRFYVNELPFAASILCLTAIGYALGRSES